MYTEKVNYRKNYLLLLIPVICFAMIIVSITTKNDFNRIVVGVIATGFLLFLTKPILRIFKGYYIIQVSSKELAVQPYLFRAGKRKVYDLKIIRNIECRKNENSESYIATAEINVGGFRHHPESSRTYIKNPITIHFYYDGEHVKIGEGLEAFNGDKIVRLIKQNKKN